VDYSGLLVVRLIVAYKHLKGRKKKGTVVPFVRNISKK
jgi:hypothetical protein